MWEQRLNLCLSSTSTFYEFYQCKDAAFMWINQGTIWDMWEESMSETGRQVLGIMLMLAVMSCLVGRTRWVSNLWGLLKKTWMPLSYHPSIIWVFNPIFSSRIAWYHITFQSQSEEMMNEGLCRQSFLDLAKSQWLVR